MCSANWEMTSDAFCFSGLTGDRRVGKVDCGRVEGVKGVIVIMEGGGGMLNVNL